MPKIPAACVARFAAFGMASLLAAGIHGAGALAADPVDPQALEHFEKKIRPVLVQHCYECHSAEAQKAGKLKAALFLDSRAGVLKGGDSGPALVAGKPKESLLIQALKHDSLEMPPKGKLPDPVIADFVTWVERGAVDPREAATVAATKREIDIAAGKQYWAFQPLAAVAPPKVKNGAWPRTPVDAFILAALEAKNLAPQGPATKEKLLRRVTFDLIGLPPTPTEVEAFLKDESPQAYERVVDRLLASEQYGERWARHWFDVARFAESGGYEFDRDRPGAYYYRDYVIQALNRDQPFDEFVRWQIAGDLLVPGDFQAAVATGYLVAGPFPGQTTAKTREPIRYDHLDDMISTVGVSLLGLSLGCVRCHEHKYDPIPQQDYYALIACLARTDSAEPKLDPKPEVYRQAKAKYDAEHGPLVAAREAYLQQQLPPRIAAWLKTPAAQAAPAWLALDAVSAAGKAPLAKQADGSLLAAPKAAGAETYTIVAHTLHAKPTALRIEALPDPSLPQGGPGRGENGGFQLSELTVVAEPLAGKKKGQKQPLKLALLDGGDATTGPAASIDGKKETAWAPAVAAGQPVAARFALEGAADLEGAISLTIGLAFEGQAASIGRVRLAISAVAPPPAVDQPSAPQAAAEVRVALAAAENQVTDANRAQVARWWRALEPEWEKLEAAVEAHAKTEPKPDLVGAFIASSGKGGDVHFLVRGETSRKQGVASPGFVQTLVRGDAGPDAWLVRQPGDKPLQAEKPVKLDPRAALAHWLTDPASGAGNLLARVLVNRLWLHHFGQGLVRTPNDFGAQGDPPTHPELLNWLAQELVRGGWKQKPLHKLLVTSAVYQQAGELLPAAQQADPENRLWWRRIPRRLEAEAIRDSLLAASGTLDPKMFGPGTLDENNNRRSVYLTLKRSRLLPMMQMYDAPEGIQSVGRRQATTVATQALALMNSPFVRDRAAKLAARAKPAAAAELPQAIEQAYLAALSRKPTVAERDRAVAYVQTLSTAAGPGTPTLDAAFTDFCQVLLCSSEMVYVD